MSGTKQCYHFGTIGHSEKWFLVSKREKGIAKRTILKTYQNPTQLFGQSSDHKRNHFITWEVRKSMASFDDITKIFFRWKIKKILSLRNFAGNQLSRVSWIIIKFGVKIPDTCSYVSGGLTLYGANQGV